MKSIKNLRASLFLTSVALGAVGLLIPNVIFAEGKGSAKLMFPPPGQVQPQTLPAAKMCPQCTDRFTKVVDTARKGMGASLKTVAVHNCPACSTTITSTGTGKTKTDKVNHRCGAQACCMVSR